MSIGVEIDLHVRDLLQFQARVNLAINNKWSGSSMVEQKPFKLLVPGSSPGRITRLEGVVYYVHLAFFSINIHTRIAFLLLWRYS